MTADLTAQLQQVREDVGRIPRVRLGHLPTPLEPLLRLSAEMAGPPIYIKRDDCTGLAMGGNKTRHNEFILAHALSQKADVFVWGAGVQSNNCRQTAAACAKLGLECKLFLGRGNYPEEIQGNLLLDHILGADVTIVDEHIGPALDERLLSEAEALRKAGRTPYVWDRHIVKPRAAISYVLCLVEILEQLQAENKTPQAVYVCSAGSTGVGLLAAKARLGLDFPVRNIAPIRWPWDLHEDLAAIANEVFSLLGWPQRLSPSDIDATEDFVGDDYGIPSPAGMQALSLIAQTEGILLDPIYTAKALAAVLHDIQTGKLDGDGPVVFVHTGGTPALFAYHSAVSAACVEGAAR